MDKQEQDNLKEERRLEGLRALGLLDTMPEVEYDQVVRLASVICGTPISLVSLVDENRQWFKAAFGLGVRETPRNVSFCAYAIQQSGLFIVGDASKDRRFSDNALVTNSPGIRFYAGVPLFAGNGTSIGTLCVIDTVPRELTEEQKKALEILAVQVQAHLDLRTKQAALEASFRENQRLTVQLQESNSLFQTFMNTGPFLSYMKDSAGRFVFYNRRMNELFGVKGDEWIGRTDHDVWPEEIADQFRRHDLEVMAGGVPVELTEMTTDKGEGRFDWKSFKFVFKQQSGDVMLGGLSIDVTADLKRERALERTLKENAELVSKLEGSEALFRTFMDFVPLHVFLKSEDGKYVFYNRHFAEQLGIDQTAWIGKTDFEVLPLSLAERFRQSDLLALKDLEPVELYDELPNARGEIRKLRGIRFTYLDARGNRTIAGLVIDMSDLLTYKEQLEESNRKLGELATTDSLTGLNNRRVFEERIEVEYRFAKRKGREMTLLLLDIDNFKKRNDQFGHAAGDEALKALGQVLLLNLRVGDMAARIGGEEFAILFPETDTRQGMLLAERIRAQVSATACGTETLTVSIGAASTREATESAQQLLAFADEAMYAAKRAGKDCIVLHQKMRNATARDENAAQG